MVHQCVIKSLVMWLHILAMSFLMYVALFGSRQSLAHWLVNNKNFDSYQDARYKRNAQCLSSRRAELWTVKALQYRASRCENISDSCVEVMLEALRYRDTYRHFVGFASCKFWVQDMVQLYVLMIINCCFRGSVPPGARFDPVGPPGPEPRSDLWGTPNADHLAPPGYDDMFM